MTALVGPATIDCTLRCDVPAGVEMTEVPPPRHDWSDVVRCPNAPCERVFLVTKKET